MRVGDYVRIENKVGCCYIGKIYNINDYREPSTKYCIDIQAKDFVFIGEESICKSSPNIIDLIEVGDILTIRDIFGNLSKVEVDENFKLLSGKIVSIITKEQFESMEYRIGE